MIGVAEICNSRSLTLSAGAPTCSTNGADVLPAKFTAVMVWLPDDSVDVAKVATPPTPTVPVPSVVPPSLNVTVPVGVPVPLVTVTVAVKVTSCPGVLGLGDAVNAVAVVSWLTRWVSDTGPLPVKLVSSTYVAVMV
jgi:hypothetical protein